MRQVRSNPAWSSNRSATASPAGDRGLQRVEGLLLHPLAGHVAPCADPVQLDLVLVRFLLQRRHRGWRRGNRRLAQQDLHLVQALRGFDGATLTLQLRRVARRPRRAALPVKEPRAAVSEWWATPAASANESATRATSASPSADGASASFTSTRRSSPAAKSGRRIEPPSAP